MVLLEINDKVYKIPKNIMKAFEDMSDYIEKLEEENIKLKKNINNAIKFIEQHRIREKCIVDVNTLEGLLNE